MAVVATSGTSSVLEHGDHIDYAELGMNAVHEQCLRRLQNDG